MSAPKVMSSCDGRCYLLDEDHEEAVRMEVERERKLDALHAAVEVAYAPQSELTRMKPPIHWYWLWLIYDRKTGINWIGISIVLTIVSVMHALITGDFRMPSDEYYRGAGDRPM